MAIYQYTSVITYLDVGGPTLLNIGTTITPLQDLNDNSVDPLDNVFSLGEGIEQNNSGSDLGTFAGTIVHDGATFIVVQNGSVYYAFTSDTYSSAPDFAPGDLNTSDATVCFAAGTLIDTANGAVPVETLAAGDLIVTRDNRLVPVKWIGRQTVSTLFRRAERLNLVRFAAGSLGNGLPHSDLTVTTDHAMLVDGVLCNAGALVNDVSIVRVPAAELGDSYTVYHVETEDHEIILANGAATETFIDNVSRRVFDNFAELDALYGDVPEMVELPLPRALSARQVPATIRARLAGAIAA